jgi:pseudaminic acid biosynthesis-associated methylase
MAETQQLDAWRGQFGDGYIGRNLATEEAVRQRVYAWARILRSIESEPPKSVIEVGANVGRNLKAFAALTGAELYGLEPNARARAQLVADGIVSRERALDGTAQKIPLKDGAVDLSFTSGVLIHIHPDDLPAACRELARVARRHVAVIEYFADQPTAIEYRGRKDLLFKRDFGGFLMDTVPGLRPVDCGFFWRRTTGMDNLTWWLFEKRPA